MLHPSCARLLQLSLAIGDAELVIWLGDNGAVHGCIVDEVADDAACLGCGESGEGLELVVATLILLACIERHWTDVLLEFVESAVEGVSILHGPIAEHEMDVSLLVVGLDGVKLVDFQLILTLSGFAYELV